MIEHMHTRFKSFGVFPVTKEQYERYRSGGLWQQWLKDYPNIFDKDDQKVAQKNAHRGVGFYESLAAVLIYHTTGHLSLVDYYQYGTHVRKNGVFRKLVGSEVMDVVRQTRTYCPDLLVYKVDLSDWYFVEVKGHRIACE